MASLVWQLQCCPQIHLVHNMPCQSTPPSCFTLDNFSKRKAARKIWTSPDLYTHDQCQGEPRLRRWWRWSTLLRRCRCGCVCQAWRARCSAEVAGQSLLHHTAPQPAQRPRPHHQREWGEGVGEANWRQVLLFLVALHLLCRLGLER